VCRSRDSPISHQARHRSAGRRTPRDGCQMPISRRRLRIGAASDSLPKRGRRFTEAPVNERIISTASSACAGAAAGVCVSSAKCRSSRSATAVPPRLTGGTHARRVIPERSMPDTATPEDYPILGRCRGDVTRPPPFVRARRRVLPPRAGEYDRAAAPLRGRFALMCLKLISRCRVSTGFPPFPRQGVRRVRRHIPNRSGGARVAAIGPASPVSRGRRRPRRGRGRAPCRCRLRAAPGGA
jgi:hypothetical protein